MQFLWEKCMVLFLFFFFFIILLWLQYQIEAVIADIQLLTFPVDGSTDVLKRLLHQGLKQTACRHFQILNKEEFLAVSVLKISHVKFPLGKKMNIRTSFILGTDLQQATESFILIESLVEMQIHIIERISTNTQLFTWCSIVCGARQSH